MFAMSVAEFAKMLGVGVEDVLADGQRGRLRVISVNGQMRVLGETLDAVIASLQDGPAEAPLPVDAPDEMDVGYGWSLRERRVAAGFEHLWPDGYNETYTEAVEAQIVKGGRTRELLIGRGVRYAAGRDRYRVVVFLRTGGSRYPLCEFVGGNDLAAGGKLASVIKVEGQQLRDVADVPAELMRLPVAPYRSVVNGPHASHGLAVVCDSDDLRSICAYAVFRAEEKQLLE